jgi:periplasmic copper chaperone A
MKYINIIALTLSLAAHMNMVMAHQDSAVKTAPQQAEVQAIVHVLKKQFDKPKSPLTVMPVTVEGDWAMAGWLQDMRGGRALLNKRHGQWVIVVCGGDGLRQAITLAQTGMKADEAQALAMKLQAAESRLPAETLRKFSSFEGMLRVDGGAHGAHGKHPKH